MSQRLIAWLACALVVVLAGCGMQPATQQAQATAPPPSEPTPTLEPTPEPTPDPTPTSEPTAEPTPELTPTPEPQETITAVDPPDDWLRVDMPDLTLALPQHWQILGTADAQGPETPPKATPAPGTRQVQLNAVDFNPEREDETGFVTRLQIMVERMTEPLTPEQVADRDAQEVKALPGVEDLAITPIKIADTDAVRLRWKLQEAVVEGPARTLVVERYVVTAADTAYRIEFTMSAAQVEAYREELDRILASLRRQTAGSQLSTPRSA